MVHKGKSSTRKGLPEGRNGCVRAGERQEKATGSRPATGYLMTIYWFGGTVKNGRLLPRPCKNAANDDHQLPGIFSASRRPSEAQSGAIDNSG
ncbi:hypothetical protein NFH48_30840, partial [Pseudomonas aeruginosa]|uniref:hypothetical protein n=1 Tax=Pseudomonas aeruginosa TaxID=287 RepID=UPI0020767F52